MPSTETSSRRPRDHLVHLYRTDAELDAAMTAHLVGGWEAGEAVVLIATPERRARFEGHAGTARLLASDRYHPQDARSTLESFMVDGSPDRGRFEATVGVLVADLARRFEVRAFGEMVALLWDDGNVSAALRLEELWNELRAAYDFSLYCAYPMATLEAHGGLDDAQRVCQVHADVIGPTEPAPTAPDGDAASTMFTPEVTAPAEARRFVAGTLDEWGWSGLADDAVIVTSELVSNAVLHAQSVLRLDIVRTESALRIEVTDADETSTPVRGPATDHAAVSGRGLPIVVGLSSSFGTEARDGGKVVWAELAAP